MAMEQPGLVHSRRKEEEEEVLMEARLRSVVVSLMKLLPTAPPALVPPALE
jgi:hypothetical protein